MCYKGFFIINKLFYNVVVIALSINCPYIYITKVFSKCFNGFKNFILFALIVLLFTTPQMIVTRNNFSILCICFNYLAKMIASCSFLMAIIQDTTQVFHFFSVRFTYISRVYSDYIFII